MALKDLIKRKDTNKIFDSEFDTKIKLLFSDQKKEWEFCGNNYSALDQVRIKEIPFDGFSIHVQFNPNRMISTSADTDDEAIKKRECFLCNLPAEQRKVIFNKRFDLLVNPYPIFKEHFTIIKRKHQPQTIIGNFETLLDLTKSMGNDYTLFYNGPRCGASAPDHMHFQAGSSHKIPIENDYDFVVSSLSNKIYSDSKINIYAIEKYLRRMIAFESVSKGDLLFAYKLFVDAFKRISLPKDEPMMNILSWYRDNKWRIVFIPRRKHRPDAYFEKGEKQLLISPAAIDLGGLIITPRLNEFELLNKELVTEIYREVTLTNEHFEYLKNRIVTSILSR
ncbi:MAG: DUF4922 domain-containing protein [Melioribacteraceae bacterium]